MILVNSQLPGDSVTDCITYSIYMYPFYREFDTALILGNGHIACHFCIKLYIVLLAWHYKNAFV